MSAGITPPGTLYGRSAPPTVSLVPPPVTVPPFAAVQLSSGGLRQRLTAMFAHQRRRGLVCVFALIAALSLLVLGRVAQAPEEVSPTSSSPGSGSGSGSDAAGGGGAEKDGATGSSRASGPSTTDAAGAGAADVPARLVSAPVRIADADAVRLLSPGDRVDVLASPSETATTTRARLVAHRARVTKLPASRGSGARDKEISEAGALIVLAVPPSTARDLAGAGAHSQLAVTVW